MPTLILERALNETYNYLITDHHHHPSVHPSNNNQTPKQAISQLNNKTQFNIHTHWVRLQFHKRQFSIAFRCYDTYDHSDQFGALSSKEKSSAEGRICVTSIEFQIWKTNKKILNYSDQDWIISTVSYNSQWHGIF